jgi:hypothetical protein
MSAFKKLAEAREKLLELGVKKTGKNQHQGFEYYELADFIPAITRINKEVGLVTNTSFDHDLCKLFVNDVEGGEAIEFCTPMATAQLPGKAQPVQNLGATITYMRRYLYMLAYDITEPDHIDSADQKSFESTNKGWKNVTAQFIDDIKAIGVTKGDVTSVCVEFEVDSPEKVKSADRPKFLGRLNSIKVNGA